MKYTVEGFQQEGLVRLGLDATDAVLLRWFVDFMESGRMESTDVSGRRFYWIRYAHVLADMPILGITASKGNRALGRRLKKLVAAGVLEYHEAHSKVAANGKRVAGRFTYYRPGKAYAELLATSTSEACASKGTRHVPQEAQGMCLKKHDKDPSTRDPSTRDGGARETVAVESTEVVKVRADKLEKLDSEYGRPIVRHYAEKIADHCESTGKKYRDHAATIRNWIRRDKERGEYERIASHVRAQARRAPVERCEYCGRPLTDGEPCLCRREVDDDGGFDVMAEYRKAVASVREGGTHVHE